MELICQVILCTLHGSRAVSAEHMLQGGPPGSLSNGIPDAQGKPVLLGAESAMSPGCRLEIVSFFAHSGFFQCSGYMVVTKPKLFWTSTDKIVDFTMAKLSKALLEPLIMWEPYERIRFVCALPFTYSHEGIDGALQSSAEMVLLDCGLHYAPSAELMSDINEAKNCHRQAVHLGISRMSGERKLLQQLPGTLGRQACISHRKPCRPVPALSQGGEAFHV